MVHCRGIRRRASDAAHVGKTGELVSSRRRQIGTGDAHGEGEGGLSMFDDHDLVHGVLSKLVLCVVVAAAGFILLSSLSITPAPVVNTRLAASIRRAHTGVEKAV